MNNLPEKFAIKITDPSQARIFLDWLPPNIGKDYTTGELGRTFFHYPSLDKEVTRPNGFHTACEVHEGFKEIKFEDFQNSFKKVIGYKFKDEKYRNPFCLLANITDTTNVENEYFMSFKSLCRDIAEEDGILEKWFTPVYSKDIEIELGSKNLNLKITKESVIFDVVKFSWKDINKIFEESIFNSYTVKVESVSIGCTTFTRSDYDKAKILRDEI